MKFLITGASGFLGKKLSIELIEKHKGAEFVFIARNRKIDFLEEYKDRAKITAVKGDITDIKSIEKYFKGVDTVFHLAAYLAYGNINENIFYDINVKGSENIFELCLKNKVKKVIYLSSAGIYHPTFYQYVNEKADLADSQNTKYTRSKYLAYLKSLDYIRKGVPIINVLPVSIFGEESPLFKPLIKQVSTRFVLIPKVDTRLSLSYVGDVVDGIIKTFKKGKIGESYILSGKSLSLKGIVKKIARVMNKKIIIIELPKVFFVVILKILDFFAKVFHTNFYYNSEIFNYISGGLIAYYDKARKELDFAESDFNENFNKMIKSIK